MSDQHPAFEWLRSETIESLGIRVDEYRHRKTGAQHLHIDSDNDENVFLVALRTVPTDSRGVAHILEHTALCGSEKYPVRDPFFMMIRRSLNTFMNAFTSSDWTAYPFASQNKKDFNNLLDVYLDAVFFSRLDPLDFAQEGHRLEFAESDNPNSELQYKGVVFNEMKGAMSSVPSTLWQTMTKYLFPNNTYHYNSGGDPEHIPDLTYEQLKAFYQVHYHPSNSVFMTFGNIPAHEHQVKFEEQALNRFEALPKTISVADEKRLHAPIRVEEAYALESSDGCERKTHILLGWLLDHTTDLEYNLKAQLLSAVLLDNSSSPLLHSLETSDLGDAPSPLCGVDDSNREMTFMCGLEGSEVEQAEALEQQILDVLQQIAEQGVEQSQVEAMLHQLELSQREIGGDGYPFGLQIILSALPSAIHRGDAVAALNIDSVLAKLREQIKDRDFIPNLVRELLIDNPHRVRLVLRPDEQLAERRDAVEKSRLQAIQNQLDEPQKQQIVDAAAALEARQQQIDDESILPKVELSDVAAELNIADGSSANLDQFPLTFYGQGTNGIVYQQMIVPLPPLDDEELDLLGLYSSCLTEVGAGEKDYLATQAWQASVCGGISAYTSFRGQIDDEQQVKGHLVLSAKALSSNHQAVSELMQETLLNVHFDELPRLKELVAQIRARKEQSVTGAGHTLAMVAAGAAMSPTASMSQRLSGLTSIQKIKQLEQSLSDDAGLQSLCDKLTAIHQKMLKAPRQFLLVGEDEHREDWLQQLNQIWSEPVSSDASTLALPTCRTQLKQAWQANTQVNFCAKAYPTVTVEHDDAAALTVLGGFLRNGFLHRAIREQGGAYGSGANQDSNIAAFRFFSYRDPRLTETLDAFDESVQWLLNNEHEWQPVEEAILGVIGSIDKPNSPAGSAKLAFHNELYGRTAEQRNRFRQRVLNVTLADLKRVASTYLVPEKASIAIVSNANTLDALDQSGDLILERHIV